MMKKLFYTCMVFTLVTSCSSQKETSNIASVVITDQYWKLVEADGEIVGEPKGKEPYMTLHSKDNKVGGNASCNGYGGNYTLGSENSIQFSPLISTKMYCDGMTVETKFLNALQKVKHYQASGDSLYLYTSGDEPALKFVRGKG